MTSKERILGAIHGDPVDHTPLCFEGICHGVLPLVADRFPDPFDRARYYLDEGIDTALSIDPPITSLHGFTGDEWIEPRATMSQAESRYPIMHRTYETTRGTLEQIVRKTHDYPEHIKLFSDHNVPPSRSIRHLVMSPEDLDPLEEILRPPADDELEEFHEFANRARPFCDRNGLLLRGTLWGVGDPLFWLSGVERVLISSIDQPDFLERFVEIVARLDQRRLELLIDHGVDLVVRRGWYECADFWSPELYNRFLAPPLKRQIETAHDAGVIYVYVMNSGYAPLLDSFRSLGFDVLSNIDPISGKLPLDVLRERVDDSYALCGGINNYEVVERGTEADVVRAVQTAVEALEGSRYILAPGDSILSRSETAAQNLKTLIDTWRTLCA